MNAERDATARPSVAPPTSTADRAAYAGRTKYDAVRALRYEARSARRHAEEWKVVRRLLADVALPRTILDAPCGTGRIAAEFLELGASVRLADWSEAMLVRARARVGTNDRVLGVERLDLEAPAPVGCATDEWVVCLRFFHHLPDDEHRLRVLRSLAARASERVIVSFHHSVSVHQLARAARRVVTGRTGDRHAVTLGTISRLALRAGLQLECSAASTPFVRDFWAARFRVISFTRA